MLNEERQRQCLEQHKEWDDDYVKVADEENYEESIEPSGLWYDQSNASGKKETQSATKALNNEKLLTAAIRADEIITSGYSKELSSLVETQDKKGTGGLNQEIKNLFGDKISNFDDNDKRAILKAFQKGGIPEVQRLILKLEIG